jgi:sugar lactone lactonase YvrE
MYLIVDDMRSSHTPAGKLQKIFERIENGKERLLKGPETIFFDTNGVMYFGNDDGNLISMTDFETAPDGKMTAKTTLVADLGPGRPLGAKISGETLYVADALLGLTRIQNISDPMSKVEIVATTVVDNGTTSRLLFADDVVIGPKTGAIYFTDGKMSQSGIQVHDLENFLYSRVFPHQFKTYRHVAASVVPSERDVETLTYDLMHASKIDSLIGPSGRLLKYDPVTDEVTVLAKDIWFANGIAVDSEEEYLVASEAVRLGLFKYYLTGSKQGTTEYIVKGSPSPGCKCRAVSWAAFDVVRILLSRLKCGALQTLMAWTVRSKGKQRRHHFAMR